MVDRETVRELSKEHGTKLYVAYHEQPNYWAFINWNKFAHKTHSINRCWQQQHQESRSVEIQIHALGETYMH